jgi:hypothetical protein
MTKFPLLLAYHSNRVQLKKWNYHTFCSININISYIPMYIINIDHKRCFIQNRWRRRKCQKFLLYTVIDPNYCFSGTWLLLSNRKKQQQYKRWRHRWRLWKHLEQRLSQLFSGNLAVVFDFLILQDKHNIRTIVVKYKINLHSWGNRQEKLAKG